MPMVHIQMLTGRTEKQKAQLAEAITKAMVEYGDSNPAHTFIRFSDAEPGDWAVAGKLMSNPKL